MIDLLFTKLELINFQTFLFSIILFFIGYAFAPTVYFKKIKILSVYPQWIIKKMDILIKKDWKTSSLFIFLISVNSFSLFVNLLSGFVPGLPVLFAILTGINIGYITYHTLEGRFFYAALINPVALFELPAAFISFTLAIQYNLRLINLKLFDLPETGFSGYLNLFLITVIPLLLISGIIETFLIMISQKIRDDKNDEDKE